MRIFLTILLTAFISTLQGQQVKVYLYTNTTPSSVTVNPAPQKYNKEWVFMLSADDSNIEGWELFKKIRKHTFPDGAGKERPYSVELALNSRNNYNKAFLLENYTGKLNLDQVATMLKGGWALNNHGMYHFDSTIVLQGGGWANAGWLPQVDNIKENEKYLYRKMGERGVPWITRTWTTPSSDAGYNEDLAALGYLASSSQGTTDGYPDIAAGNVITIPAINGNFKVYRRDFSDNWPGQIASIKAKVNSLLSTSSASSRKMYRIGTHLTDATTTSYIITLLDSLNKLDDRGWITTTQEFEEYHEIVRLVAPTKQQHTTGTVTVITYDFANVPDKNRWRDMSLLLSATGANVQGVYVTGVDDYSFNPATGLLNIYSEKRAGYSMPYGATRVMNAKIPLTGDMVVTNGYSRDANLKDEYLVEGSTNFAIATVQPTDTLDVFIEADIFKKKNIQLTNIRFYDANGDAVNNPALFYGVRMYTGEHVLLASFDGSKYNAWWDNAVTDTSTWEKFYIRKTKANQSGFSRVVPAKLELYGNYTNDTAYYADFLPSQNIAFKRMYGANSYWFWVTTPGGGAELKTPQLDRLEKHKDLNRTRFYFDLTMHFLNGGQSYFFYQDSVFKWLNDRGVMVNLATKSMPKDWVKTYYPEYINGQKVWPEETGNFLNDLVPAAWGSDRKSPNSYLDRAKYEFQIAARYGRNTNIPDSLINRYMTPDYGRPPDANVKGLGYVQYMSPGNENDKDWEGTKRWLTQTGEEIAAQMSACYDGHKNTMGAGVGIKNADPTMIVLPPAFVTARNDNFMRMMRSWVIENRGYRADGVTPDWPFDEIDFHAYSNDAGGQHQSRIGKSHELSKAYAEVDTMLTFSGRFMNSMIANITETGWDTRPPDSMTTQNAIPIGPKNVYQTQADWSARMQLVSWVRGIGGIDFYELFDNQPTNPYNTMYVSTGLFFHPTQGYWSGTPGQVSNKPSGNMLIQLKKLLGNYVVDSFSVNPTDSVWKVKATYNDSVKYIVWVGRQVGATASVVLPISEGVRYDLNYNSEQPTATIVSSGAFTATEKPTVFLVGQAGQMPEEPQQPPGQRFVFPAGKKIKLKQQ